MTTNIQKAGEIARFVRLELIRLRRLHLDSLELPHPEPSELQVKARHRATYRLSETEPPSEDHRIVVLVDLELRMEPLDTPGEFDLHATFELVYSAPRDETSEPLALEHFAKLNGVHTVWPYWRELVQSSVSRVGLGPLVLPVFRVEPEELEEDDAALEAEVQ